MQQYSRSGARSDNIIPPAPTWQDAADNEEWSAWADNTTSGSAAAAAEDQDDFGAWVDSSDRDDSFNFETPISSSYVSTEQFEETNVVTVRQLRHMNSLEQYAPVSETVTTQNSSVLLDPAVGLYNNPWDDHNPAIDRSPLQDQADYSDDCDIDPEIDSALASSAWESVLGQDRSSGHSSDIGDDSDDEDDDGTYEAWNVEEQLGTGEASSNRQPITEAHAQATHDDHELGILQQHHLAPEAGLEWYKTDFNESKTARRSPPNWMQRLTGNRRKYEENARGR